MQRRAGRSSSDRRVRVYAKLTIDRLERAPTATTGTGDVVARRADVGLRSRDVGGGDDLVAVEVRAQVERAELRDDDADVRGGHAQVAVLVERGEHRVAEHHTVRVDVHVRRVRAAAVADLQVERHDSGRVRLFLDRARGNVRDARG